MITYEEAVKFVARDLDRGLTLTLHPAVRVLAYIYGGTVRAVAAEVSREQSRLAEIAGRYR